MFIDAVPAAWMRCVPGDMPGAGSMGVTADPARLFTERTESYLRFVRSVLYPQGIRAFFFASPHFRAGLRVLDAGCGTGIVTLALREALAKRSLPPGRLDAFDLTPAMLDRFGKALRVRGVADVELRQADVLHLEALPVSWTGYDLVVSASMLEYLPRERLADAIGGLRGRLDPQGTFVLFITRRNWLTRLLIGRWWESNLYTREEVHEAFRRAGFAEVAFRRFPPAFRFLDLWGLVVEGRG
jgi:cyclopropane fatty-acyl-phospholipid synthase-like methyltransferase